MSQCEKDIDCLQCNGRAMCSSYANFKYEQGYKQAIDDVIELVKVMITELDIKECTKYGNKNAELQNKSYDTLMKYEIAGSVDDLLCRLEVLKD